MHIKRHHLSQQEKPRGYLEARLGWIPSGEDAVASILEQKADCDVHAPFTITPIFVYWLVCVLVVVVIVFFRRKRAHEKYRADKRRFLIQSGAAFVCAFGIGIAGLFAMAMTQGPSLDEGSSWQLESMSARRLQDFSTGESQTMAFLDTGIDETYQRALGDRVIGCYNANDDSSDVSDRVGHGTEMVSVACSDGYGGVYGLASDSKILVAKVTDDEGVTSNEKLLKGLSWAQGHHATVVSISLGGHAADKKVESKIREMTQGGISVVAASGDDGDGDLLFPASCDSVISVAASCRDGSLWGDSNTDKSLTCAFPGEDLAVLEPGDDGVTKSANSGTSVAAAIASSYIALYRDSEETVDNSRIIETLRSLDTLASHDVDFVAPFEA